VGRWIIARADLAEPAAWDAAQSRHPEESFRLRMSFGDAAEYDVTAADPADQEGRHELPGPDRKAPRSCSNASWSGTMRAAA